jgi:hypothetical protein
VKHDPEQINITWDRYRTVLTAEAAHNLESFIKSGEYKITQNYDTKFKNSSGLFELEPNGNTPFTVAGLESVPEASHHLEPRIESS